MPESFKTLLFTVFCCILIALPVLADRATDLQTEINKKQGEIGQLDALIKKQGQELAATSNQAVSLQGTLLKINLTLNKLANEITRTETEISQTSLQIDELNLNIKSTSEDIGLRENALRKLLREDALSNHDNLLTILMRYHYLSDLLEIEEQNLNLADEIHDSALKLRSLKMNLGGRVKRSEVAKAKLVSLRQELADQKKIAANEKERQSNLLAQTKNQEQNYKKLLAVNRERRQAFTKELESFESQLRLEIDRSKLPAAHRGVLVWPLDNVQVTQYFGKTVEAKRLYASGTHNGIDLRASIGTPVKAAAPGTIAGTGDTDLVCRGASYGRWVLIKHDNGLATLYAHLSLIKAATGQKVSTGELIGYSGETGYATGPHLHFTVAAADGTEIRSLKSKTCPGTYTMPIFDARAYLDPVLYL